MVVIIGVDAVDIAVMQSVESRTRGVLDWYLDASSVGLLDAKGSTQDVKLERCTLQLS